MQVTQAAGTCAQSRRTPSSPLPFRAIWDTGNGAYGQHRQSPSTTDVDSTTSVLTTLVNAISNADHDVADLLLRFHIDERLNDLGNITDVFDVDRAQGIDIERTFARQCPPTWA